MSINKQVICDIDGQFYGMDSLSVRSIETGRAEMSLRGVPAYVEGLTRFRDEWVPLIRLRSLLNQDRSREPEFTQIAFMNTESGTLGFRVDKVVAIEEIDEQEVQKLQLFITSGKTSFIKGACKRDDRIIVVVDHNKFISKIDMKLIMEGVKAVYKAEEEEKRRREEEEAAKKAAEEEAAKRKEEENQKAQEVMRQAEEAKREAEELKRREAEEAKRKAEEEAKRRNEEILKKAEEAKKHAEEARRKAEEIKHKQEEAKKPEPVKEPEKKPEKKSSGKGKKKNK